MASEFKVRNGLIITGSMNVSESIYAPNLAPETNPAYYITWRQSDGRFEVSPAGAAGNVNAIGCWDYAGYATPPSTGEFTIRGNGSSILDSNTTEHIIIKALTKVFIRPSSGKIDEYYDEIFIDWGACVEFYMLENNWYIVSSDGLKLE
jgi:hypothetical protein